MAHLVFMEFGLDVLQDLITLDAWKSFGSLEDVSIQLQNLGLRSHAVSAQSVAVLSSACGLACFLCLQVTLLQSLDLCKHTHIMTKIVAGPSHHASKQTTQNS